MDVNNTGHALWPGLYGIVHLQQKRAALVVFVPSEAVIFNKDGLSAAVFAEGRLEVRHLDVQADDGAQVEVRVGLKPGDHIILNPPVHLRDGMKVTAS